VAFAIRHVIGTVDYCGQNKLRSASRGLKPRGQLRRALFLRAFAACRVLWAAPMAAHADTVVR
jgi:hypothetical protein